MQEKKTYIKLSDLVGSDFTVENAYGYKWKKWDAKHKIMMVEDKWEEGFQKRYALDTDKGSFEVSPSQLGQMLEAVYKGGEANIVGETFTVKSNGKQGMEIRYYINVKPQNKLETGYDQAKAVADSYKKEEAEVTDEEMEAPINLEDIPF